MADQPEPREFNIHPRSRLALDRTRLSYDRTMLSWVRTAIALISFDFSIQQFFRIARAGAPGGKPLIGPDEFGIVMILLGLLALLLATLQHRADIAALKTQYPTTAGYQELPRSQAARLAGLIALLGLALFSTLVRV
jgi:putative membrane protein